MRKLIPVFAISVLGISCAKQQAHPPVGGFFSEKEMNDSQNRAKNLNETERLQIQDWIKNQDENFYSMKMNYWVNIPDLDKNAKKQDGDEISYQYEIYDFDMVKFYEEPKIERQVHFGQFNEIRAVEDALRYMKENQEVTLLIPSVLAFGIYGDNDKISGDMPIIIKLKTL
ncbi:MAG: hypothetical protein LBE36_02690 [Flavobacteriaceae bacterium]|jgi:hypothetical protein|nr:hypothetical protein [Flavobacteriaceae bacterium]